MVDMCNDAKVAYVVLFHHCKTKLFEANTKLLQQLKKVIFVAFAMQDVINSFFYLFA